jgi:hypothetical protein
VSRLTSTASLRLVARPAWPRQHPSRYRTGPRTRPRSYAAEACRASVTVSLHIEERLTTAGLPEIPEAWNARVETVTQVLTDRHGHTRAWRLAEQQSSRIGRLLEEGALTGELLVLRHGRTSR